MHNWMFFAVRGCNVQCCNVQCTYDVATSPQLVRKWRGEGERGEGGWRGLRCALYHSAMLSLECGLVGSEVQPSALVRHLHGLIESRCLISCTEFRDRVLCCNTKLRSVKDLLLIHPRRISEILRAVVPSHLPYLKNRPDFAGMPLPSRIAGITPPDELGACTLLQKWSVEELIQEQTDEGEDESLDFVSLSVTLLSIYLYPLLTGKLLENTSQIAEITDLIDQLPVTEALPLSAFFLTNWENLTPTGRTSYAISYPNQPPKAWPTRWFPNWKTIRSWRFFGWWPAKSA